MIDADGNAENGDNRSRSCWSEVNDTPVISAGPRDTKHSPAIDNDSNGGIVTSIDDNTDKQHEVSQNNDYSVAIDSAVSNTHVVATGPPASPAQATTGSVTGSLTAPSHFSSSSPLLSSQGVTTPLQSSGVPFDSATDPCSRTYWPGANNTPATLVSPGDTEYPLAIDNNGNGDGLAAIIDESLQVVAANNVVEKRNTSDVEEISGKQYHVPIYNHS
jgi:hypothetical protein